MGDTEVRWLLSPPGRRRLSLKAPARQPSLFGLACALCPAQDCPDRDDAGRGCRQVELQAPDRAALTHLSPVLPAILDELDDFRLPDRLPQASAQVLPPYVPQIEPRTPLLDRVPRTTALALGRFVSSRGTSYTAGIERARLLRELGASVVVLVGTSKDPQLDVVWKEPLAFINALRAARVDIVLGPAFSVYVGRPPLERLWNRSRNLMLYQCLSEAGIQTIPAAGFIDAADAAFVGDWAGRYGLQSIFVDQQSADDLSSWNEVRQALPSFIARATSLRRIVINGVGQPGRVIELSRLTKPLELVLTNASAFHLARSRLDYFAKNERLVKGRSGAPPTQLFANLARFYNDAAARRTERYIPLSVQPRMF